MSVVFGTHNFTEGTPTSEDAESDILVGQEVDRHRTRAGLPDHGIFFPLRDKHQCIAWNKDVFRRDGLGKAIRLHGSGRAEGWPFPSPSRYLLLQRLMHRQSNLHLSVFGVWLINSWNPMPEGRDEDTEQRAQIAADSLKIVVNRVEAEKHAGRAVLMGGDFNSVRASLVFDGLRQVGPAHGLDRLFFAPPFLLKRTWSGPTTGVGPDDQHHSRHAEFDLAFH